jgi:hypothetical protein
MKIKLKGIDELEAFTVIVRCMFKTVSGSIESLVDLCNLMATEKLLLKLINITGNALSRPPAKTFTVTLDELQLALLYEALLSIPFGTYEQNLANRLMVRIEQYFYNAMAYRMSKMDQNLQN